MPIFGRKNKKSGRKKYQNKALTSAQAREIEQVAGTDPTGGASTTADTKLAEGSKQTRTETAADYRARRQAELDAKKRALVTKQKKVTADKAAKAAEAAASKPDVEEESTKSVLPGKDEAAEQDRMKQNQKNRAAAVKAGKSTYKFVNKKGQNVIANV